MGKLYNLLFLALLLVTPWLAYSEDATQCQIPKDYLLTPPSEPTTVDIGLYVIDIDKIDSVTQSFTLDFVLGLAWHDPRLAQNVDSCQFKLEDVWNPNVQLFNMQTIKQNLPDIVKVDQTGYVIYIQRIHGDLSARFNLRSFPFDQQILPIILLSFGHTTDDVKFVFERKRLDYAIQFSLTDWDILKANYDINSFPVKATLKEKNTITNIPRFEFRIHAKRKVEYFIWKVLLPLMIIVLMSWSVFWINPNEKVQINIATTAVLTSIAYLFVLGRYLPPVSYLTMMDIFVYISLISIFMAFIVAVTTTALKIKGKEEIGIHIHKRARWLFPLLYTLAIVFYISLKVTLDL